MEVIVRVHRPTLTQEEREARMQRLREATIEYFRETMKMGEKKND